MSQIHQGETQKAASGDAQVTNVSDDAQAGRPVSKDDGLDRLVPVGEAIRYRKRAQTAEQELNDLRGRFQDLQVELEHSHQAVTQLERRQKIDELLTGAEAVDLDVARLLTEAAVEMMDEPDVRLAIEDLRRHKPYLFRKHQSERSVMPVRHRENGTVRTHQAAEQASVSGDRRDLLKYLRLRRKK